MEVRLLITDHANLLLDVIDVIDVNRYAVGLKTQVDSGNLEGEICHAANINPENQQKIQNTKYIK